MDDKEMLELAALAAGLVIEYQNGVPCVMKPGSGWPFPLPWDPCGDDGDALRLAVKLRMTDLALVVGQLVLEQGEQADIYATTRRAITRAAAEIGKTMKGGAA